MTTNLGSALNGVHPPSAGFTLLQGIGGYSTTPRVLPKFLDIPRAAMIKMVYSTGDLLLPRVTRVPYPDSGFWWTLGCLAASASRPLHNSRAP